MSVVEILVLAAGAFGAAATLGSAVRSVVLPRAIPARITRRVFLGMRRLFKLRMGRSGNYEKRDRIMAYYGPSALLALLASWLVLEMASFTAIYWSLGVKRWGDAFAISGSSLTTLGFARQADMPNTAVSIAEAAIGLVLLALLITYLPSIYTAFSRREQQVATLEVRAGYPPSPAVMLTRLHRIGWSDRLPEVWKAWESWFIDVEETHTTFPALAFFRSPQPYHSWVTAAGVILDTASLAASTLERPRDADAELCIRAGYVALRRIAGFFRIPYNADPQPGDPVTIRRDEYDALCAELEAAGVPLKKDREQAWRDFAGWRVNYDTVLVELAALVMAPPGTWSSDRLVMAGRPTGPGDHMQTARTGKIRRLR